MGVVEVWWREVDEGVERWMVCVVVCEWSACVREVIVALVDAPARSRRLRMRRVREVERGVRRLVEVAWKVDNVATSRRDGQCAAATARHAANPPSRRRPAPSCQKSCARVVCDGIAV